MATAMAPVVTELTAETQASYRGNLFERVQDFRFVHRTAGRMRISTSCLGMTTVAMVESTGHDIVLQESGRATVLMPLHGRLGVEGRGHTLEVAGGGAMVLRAGHRVTRTRAGADGWFSAMVLLVPERGHGLSASRHTPPGRVLADLGQNAAARALHGFMSYVVAETTEVGSPLHRPGLVGSANTLLMNLFAALDGTDMQAQPAGMAAARVALAEDYMRARREGAVSMDEVARAAGTGERALQAAFRAVRGLSPLAVLRDMRLDGARARLLRALPGANVSDIALASGLGHFGRFAAAYRQRFGEPPSETLRRALG